MLRDLLLRAPPFPLSVNHPLRMHFREVCEELRRNPRAWLVTGAAGFIGSNLVQELLGLGQYVTGLDNFATGHQHNLDEALSAVNGGEGRFRFVEGDIRVPETCRTACDGVEYVLHHAAQVSVPGSIADPVLSTRVNVEGHLNVLLASRDAGVRRVVYASSSAVYGDTTRSPQLENEVGHLLSPYAASKAANEAYAAVFQRVFGLESIGLRYFNIFGPRQDPDGAYAAVIPRWIANLLRGVPCEIFGDGLTSRDFCHVANVVQANILAATSSNVEAIGEVYNIACGEETSLNALYSILQNELTVVRPDLASVRPHHNPPRPGDIRRSSADIEKARSRLGFEPVRSTSAGLHDTLAWYCSRLGVCEDPTFAQHDGSAAQPL